MINFKKISVEWESTKGYDWINEIGKETEITKSLNDTNLDFNVTIKKKKTNFDNLLNKFIALLGISIATTSNSWERVVLGVFLALIICPFKIDIFKNNETKRLFDLIENEFGDNYIDKNRIELKEDTTLLKVLDHLKRKDMIEEENDRYYFKEIILKSINIGRNK